MRLLAYDYDNCLIHPQIQENVKNIVEFLGVDLITKENARQENYLVTNLRAYLRKPFVGMIPLLCTGCRYGIIGNAFHVAHKYSIPTIAIGRSP